jgi:hypothetical protein
MSNTYRPACAERHSTPRPLRRGSWLWRVTALPSDQTTRAVELASAGATRHAGNDDDLVDSAVAALAFGWTRDRLRVWRHRNHGALPIASRGAHGVALYRWADVRHAAEQMLAERSNVA